MKKGCFLKFIIIFTIVLAAALYIVQNKFDELFLKPGKELAIPVIEKYRDNDLNYIHDNPEKDSLISLLNYYISEIKSIKKLDKNSTEGIIDLLGVSGKDSLIDKNELSDLKKLINNTIKNEK